MIKGEVTAECIESTTQRGNTQVLVLKEEKGSYVNHLAVECYGKTFEMGQTVRAGDRVKVTGYVASRQWKGRWFTAFKALAITVVGGAVKRSREETAPRDDDNGIPF